MSKTTPTRPDPPQTVRPAESAAWTAIEAVLQAPQIRAATLLDAMQPRLATLRARAEAVRTRLQALQAAHGPALNARVNRDYRALSLLLPGGLPMKLQEVAVATRSVFEGRMRGNGTIHEGSVFSALDRADRLLRQVVAADVHQCPTGRPGCACLLAQVETLVTDAEQFPGVVTKGLATIDDLERRIAGALKARGVDGHEEMAPPILKAAPPAPRSSTQAVTDSDVLR